MTAALPHGGADLVVFDVDGTLHDTFQWWSTVLVQALAQFGREHGVAIEEPSRADADAVVGLKDEQVWGAFLPAAHRASWPRMREIAVPLEVDVLHARDYLYPGVPSLLARLRAAGVGLALASNCRREYFEAVCLGQGLGPATDRQYCLDSPGITDKTSMVRTAVDAAGAQRPVMVGDREPDCDAAEALGVPFIWRANDRCDLTSRAAWVWNGEPDALVDVLLPSTAAPDVKIL